MSAPDGRTWWVKRAWMPRHSWLTRRWRDRRRRRREDERPDSFLDKVDFLPDGCDIDDPIVGIVSLVAVILVGLLAWFVLLPLLLLVVDAVVAVLLLLLAGLVRVLFRRPWDVVAVHERPQQPPEVQRWEVVGFSRAGRVRDAAAEALRAGVDPDPVVLRVIQNE